MKLLLISGVTASGKTTLARMLSERLAWPLVGKDDIKELMFDELGYGSREKSVEFGRVSIRILYMLIGRMSGTDGCLIVESNFRYDRDRDGISELLKNPNDSVWEVHCYGDAAVLHARYKSRVESGRRHPGHVDDKSYDETKEILDDPANYKALGIARVLEVDTTAGVDSEMAESVIEFING